MRPPAGLEPASSPLREGCFVHFSVGGTKGLLPDSNRLLPTYKVGASSTFSLGGIEKEKGSTTTGSMTIG